MSKDTSISDHKAEWCGKSYTLRATWEAVARLEMESGESYAVVFQRMGAGIPRLLDVSLAFACFALPHGKHSAQSIRAAMPFDHGQSMIDAYSHVEKAIQLAQPPAAEPLVEAGVVKAEKEAPADPR